MTDIITPIGYGAEMTYHTLNQMYDENHIKHVGNHVLVLTPNDVIGYTIESYDGYTPCLLKDKVYTDVRNIEFGNWESANDFLYGTPVAPDFNKKGR